MKKLTGKYVVEQLKRFWKFIWYDDSLLSYVMNIVVAFIFIKFLLFPGLGLVLGNDYPVVAIVSGSMEHKTSGYQVCGTPVGGKVERLSQEAWWSYCGDYYEDEFNLTLENFKEFEYKNGLNIGDVMVLYGKDPKKIGVGEVIVFVPQNRAWFENNGPVIHRVVKKWEGEDGKNYFQTKGDHNEISIPYPALGETNISEDDVIGKPIARVPWVGYAKILLNKVVGMIL